MKRLSTISIILSALVAFGASGCALDGSSQSEGSREGVSSSVDSIIAGNDSHQAGDGQQAGKATAQDPRAIAEQRVAPQPQPWRGASGSDDDPNQPQPQPWKPNPDPSDPNNQKH